MALWHLLAAYAGLSILVTILACVLLKADGMRNEQKGYCDCRQGRDACTCKPVDYGQGATTQPAADGSEV